MRLQRTTSTLAAMRPRTNPPEPSSSAPADLHSPRDRLLLRLALGGIVLALILLVTIPILVKRQISRIRVEGVEVVDSAQREVSELAFALAREMSLLRGFAVEGDPILLHDYREMRLREDEALQHLENLMPRLPRELAEQFGQVGVLASNWHTAVEAELRARTAEVAREPTPDLLFARPLHEAVLRAVRGLRWNLEANKRSALQAVERAEQFGLAVAVALALLALLSTSLVVWLGRRVRLYADRAQREHLEALRANEARSRLMRGVTHDLKNPLGVVTMYAQLLETGVHGPLTTEQSKVVSRMHASGVQMLRLVEDLVELSRAETGGLRLERESVALAPLLRLLVDDHAAAAASAGVAIELGAVDETSPVTADAQRVRQILDNLVGNAIKYVPGGGAVRLRSSRAVEGPRLHRPGWALVEVEDTGAGIPIEQLEHVFEEFVRLHGSRSGVGGSGIGLAISRQLARLMGGEITLRSEPGRGSVFTLWLPLQQPQDAPESEQPAAAILPAR